MILALETSCDDTCAAVVTTGAEIRANVISSQGVHDRYGGVVPEVASRHHLELVNDVVDDALARAEASLDDVELVAVTQGPGLIGALLVGLQTAKALAAPRELPLAPVDHLHGHVAATFLGPAPFAAPFLCLIASGGHTLLADVREPGGFDVVGRTLDDAAGEAFDKGARLLGLPYPGGPALQRLAQDGDPGAFDFPTARGVAGLDFSFAGATSGRRRRGAGGPTSPPPTSGRSWSRWCRGWSGGWPRPATRAWPSAAGWRPTARCASAWPDWAWRWRSRRRSCARTTRP